MFLMRTAHFHQKWQRVLELLADLGFDLYVPQLADHEGILRGLEDFRAHLGGRLTVMLLWEIGQGLEVNEIEPQTVMAAINLLQQVNLENAEQLAASS